MRLTNEDIGSIKACAEKHFGANCVVRLFGSRVDDTRRGGDIDLHIEVEDDALATLSRKIDCLCDLEREIGERRVDLLLEGPSRKNGYIDAVARETGVQL
ncbi:MAG: hypothetical protein CFE29_08540 [Bradyrhizobiaceae bacterium PARB1]|jgi:predicted nucleotidyltransferase|nr:MAG: hypothetical protein CFE29_08540 [Bradyrhizobiaceae bacterium PARB1]